MKINRVIATILFSISMLVCSGQEKNEKDDEKSKIIQLLNEQQYLFVANYVLPMGGRQRNIAGEGYTLKITKDKVLADLPYIGRSTGAAPIGNTDIGMKFTSSDFNYSSKIVKKKRQEITIKTNDLMDVQVIYLTVYSNGAADLRINSTNRQSISYRGDIRSLEAKK